MSAAQSGSRPGRRWLLDNHARLVIRSSWPDQLQTCLPTLSVLGFLTSPRKPLVQRRRCNLMWFVGIPHTMLWGFTGRPHISGSATISVGCYHLSVVYLVPLLVWVVHFVCDRTDVPGIAHMHMCTHIRTHKCKLYVYTYIQTACVYAIVTGDYWWKEVCSYVRASMCQYTESKHLQPPYMYTH